MTLTREQLGGIVRRPRLESRLDALVSPDPGPSLMVVSAPPGFGKSTMVDVWARNRQSDVPIAMVDLRDAGSGPRALWRALVSALIRVADAGLADELRRLAVPDRLGHEDFILDLLDTLADRSMAIVMDDVHAVRNPAVLAELDRLLARVPPSFAVVLLSRTRPPLPCLHDLRLRGRVDQLYAADLAFTNAETAACCVGLTEEQWRLVWDRTEGWPAMVRLMLLAVQHGSSEHEFWHDDEGLAEHLFIDLFSRQDAGVQEVLLVSAVADPAPLDLVVGLSGRSDAGAALSEAGRRSGLVTPVVARDGTPAYHLHPILRAYLRGEHLRRDARAERLAQARAAAWFRERGQALAAVTHALASEDSAVLESTLRAVGLRAVHEGLSEPLLEVLGGALTRERVGSWTALVGTAALLDAGRTVEGETLAGFVVPDLEGDPVLAVAHRAVLALLRRRRGRPEAAGSGMPDVPPLDVPADVELAFALHRGSELVRAGALDPAEQLLARAVELAEGLGREAALTDALISLAAVSSARADLPALRVQVERAREVAERSGWIGSTRAAYLHLLAGWTAHQQLEDAEARRLAQRASDLVDPQDDPTVVVAVRSLLAGCADDAATTDTRWLHEAWQDSGDRHLAPDLVAYTAVADAHVSLASGRVDRLRAIVAGLVDRIGDRGETILAGAELLVARGKAPEALEALEPLLSGAVPPVYPLTTVDAHVLACRIALELGNRYRAVEEIRRGLSVAHALGCSRALLGVGQPGLELLAEGRGSWGSEEELVVRLLAYVTVPPSRVAVALTDRESDVLRELPTLRTVEEIAADMVVSVNTLKTHLRSVYRKLGVSSRRDAVTEARRAGLL